MGRRLCLHIALYARPKYPDTYHYALIACPDDRWRFWKERTNLKFHVKNTLQIVDGALDQPWVYESIALKKLTEQLDLLVLVSVGKVSCTGEELQGILKGVPIYQVDDIDSEKAGAFNCVEWVRFAIETLRETGTWPCKLSWEDIRQQGISFVNAEKVSGRWRLGWQGIPGIPVLNVLDGTATLLAEN